MGPQDQGRQPPSPQQEYENGAELIEIYFYPTPGTVLHFVTKRAVQYKAVPEDHDGVECEGIAIGVLPTGPAMLIEMDDGRKRIFQEVPFQGVQKQLSELYTPKGGGGVIG